MVVAMSIYLGVMICPVRGGKKITPYAMDSAVDNSAETSAARIGKR
jgi:hypothetical protein